ncbi:MAG: FAD-dependent oxidoreductase, partial [Paracoccaceae bacterium]
MTQDIIIIGGGIAGISAGARLSHLGRVTVLEAEDAMGFHASGRSASLFDVSYGHPTASTLNRASQEYHMHANGGILSPRGLMIVARPDQRELFERDSAKMEMREISVPDARAMIPILNPETVGFAGYHAEAWDMDTDRLLQNFAKELRGNGGQVLTGQRVTAIARTGTGWRVETGRGEFEA